MPTIKDRSLVALAVLTLLVEQPRHPYEMKTAMRERGHDRVIRLRGGSLYDTVERLLRAGLIETTEKTRAGRRPERTVYRLTDNGRDELRSWMLELVSEPVTEYPQFAAALAFLGVLEKKEAISQLRSRVVALEAKIAAEKRTTDLLVGETRLPRLFLIEAEYFLAMLKAELAFTRRLATEITEGTIEWPNAAMFKRMVRLGLMSEAAASAIRRTTKKERSE